MTQLLTFTIHEGVQSRQQEIAIQNAVIAGWTGRDRDALEKHIAELEEMGIARPASTPIFYRVSAARLTFAQNIEVTGNHSSGEVEFVLVRHAGRLFVGVGSDHTDRKVEAYGVTVSKQMCDKPIAPELWAYDEIRPHWDQLVLRSRLVDGTIYQEGSVTKMLDPDDLLGLYGDPAQVDGTVMFGGTLAAIGGIRPSEKFSFEIEDPVLKRTISHGYSMAVLPVAG